MLWLLTGTVIVVTRWWEHRPWSWIGVRHISWRAALLAAVLGVALGIAVHILTVATSRLLSLSKGGTVDTVAASGPVWLVLAAVLTASVVEELLFRAYPIERLARLTGARWPGALLSLAAFAAMGSTLNAGHVWLSTAKPTRCLDYWLGDTRKRALPEYAVNPRGPRLHYHQKVRSLCLDTRYLARRLGSALVSGFSRSSRAWSRRRHLNGLGMRRLSSWSGATTSGEDGADSVVAPAVLVGPDRHCARLSDLAGGNWPQRGKARRTAPVTSGERDGSHRPAICQIAGLDDSMRTDAAACVSR